MQQYMEEYIENIKNTIKGVMRYDISGNPTFEFAMCLALLSLSLRIGSKNELIKESYTEEEIQFLIGSGTQEQMIQPEEARPLKQGIITSILKEIAQGEFSIAEDQKNMIMNSSGILVSIEGLKTYVKSSINSGLAHTQKQEDAPERNMYKRICEIYAAIIKNGSPFDAFRQSGKSLDCMKIVGEMLQIYGIAGFALNPHLRHARIDSPFAKFLTDCFDSKSRTSFKNVSAHRLTIAASAETSRNLPGIAKTYGVNALISTEQVDLATGDFYYIDKEQGQILQKDVIDCWGHLIDGVIASKDCNLYISRMKELTNAQLGQVLYSDSAQETYKHIKEGLTFTGSLLIANAENAAGGQILHVLLAQQDKTGPIWYVYAPLESFYKLLQYGLEEKQKITTP